MPRPPSTCPNRDRLHRAIARRPARGQLAGWLIARHATAPDGEPAPADRRARCAVRLTEWLLGLPAGTTRAALAEIGPEVTP
jgi:hypothetical protein